MKKIMRFYFAKFITHLIIQTHHLLIVHLIINNFMVKIKNLSNKMWICFCFETFKQDVSHFP